VLAFDLRVAALGGRRLSGGERFLQSDGQLLQGH
jgi:hypothetical protein